MTDIFFTISYVLWFLNALLIWWVNFFIYFFIDFLSVSEGILSYVISQIFFIDWNHCTFCLFLLWLLIKLMSVLTDMLVGNESRNENAWREKKKKKGATKQPEKINNRSTYRTVLNIVSLLYLSMSPSWLLHLFVITKQYVWISLPSESNNIVQNSKLTKPKYWKLTTNNLLHKLGQKQALDPENGISFPLFSVSLQKLDQDAW